MSEYNYLEDDSWHSIWKDKVLDVKLELATNIREYCSHQKDLWNKIPELAWRANGRNGWLDNWSRASRYKVWALNSSVDCGYYKVFIDLETGNLINAGTKNIANDIEVFKINPAEIDARKEIEYLNKRIEEPIGDYFKEKYEEYIAAGMKYGNED